MYTIDKLKEMAQVYFDNDGVVEILATTDGHFFHIDSKSHAENHCKRTGASIELIKKEDNVKQQPKETKEVKEVVKNSNKKK